ncbi:hypothetical protein TCON_2173 [Astathelohania contejeani]|uniref:Uncharacterized protein n=1 Tax=Astathelohania contejeani TaxID=164912 RepID=A0ABQ7HWR5_9MICR|nr:hypothetical protein TCON_2173 [Thelohania contejeani]
MDFLLKTALNPAAKDRAEEELEARIMTKEGLDELLGLLNQNDTLAFIFFKNTVSLWLNQHRINHVIFLISFLPDNIIDLINKTGLVNFNILLATIENLSFYNLINFDLVDKLCALSLKEGVEIEIIVRYLQVLKSIFIKYEKQTKSDELYTEINHAIESCKELVKKFLDEYYTNEILDIFYLLSFQDLHPYFEDNAGYFFNIFFRLYQTYESQGRNYLGDASTEHGKLCRIFNLYLVKYSGVIDIEALAYLLLENSSIPSPEYFYLTVANLIKKIKDITPHTPKIIEIIMDAALLKTRELEEVLADPIRYSKDSLALHNDNRSIVKEIFQACTRFPSLKEELKEQLLSDKNILPNLFEEERRIYIFMIMKHSYDKVKFFLENPLLYDSKLEQDSFELLLITCFRTYIIRRDYSLLYLMPTYIELRQDKPYSLLSQYYFSRAVDSLSNTIIHPTLISVDSLFDKGINEFSSGLLFSLAYNEYSTGQGIMFSENIANCIINLIDSDLSSLTNYDSYFYLFDILGFMVLRHVNIPRIIALTEKILNLNIIELYDLNIYLVSIIARCMDVNPSYLTSLLTYQHLWNDKRMVFPLCCLASSFYERGFVTDEFIVDLIKRLINGGESTCAYFLLNRINLRQCNPKMRDILYSIVEPLFNIPLGYSEPQCYLEEELIILYYNYQINKPEKKENLIKYLENNYISKRNIRRVLMVLNDMVKERDEYSDRIEIIINKNKGMGDTTGGLPRSIITVFKL